MTKKKAHLQDYQVGNNINNQCHIGVRYMYREPYARGTIHI